MANNIVDLHMHSLISDGSDTPAEIISRVKAAGIGLFSLTDHDDISGCAMVQSLLKEGDPAFIPGVEFSCKDDEGKYHILGYCYDPAAPSVNALVATAHDLRMDKARARVDFVRNEFGFDIPEDEVEAFLALPNPGKPHLGNLLVKYGYAPTKETAIKEYINRSHVKSRYIRPEEAIEGILGAGGIPVLAHPTYGSGDQIIRGEEMDVRLRKLVSYGLAGVEAFYSLFDPSQRAEMLAFAEKYDLYVTAGSDYHGTNKTVIPGDTGLTGMAELPRGMKAFFERISYV